MTYILLSTLVGGIIGWSTNVLAVKLIFRPFHPYSILGLFSIQGLIPKRKNELAQAIGETVENELLSGAEIVDYLNSPELQTKIINEIVLNIKQKISAIIPGFIPSGLKSHLFDILEGIIEGEVARFFHENLPKMSEEMKTSLPIASMVEEKINKLNLRELEIMILRIAHKELKHIEYLGGILGVIIGLIQGLLFKLLTL